MKNIRGVGMERRGDWHGARQQHEEALKLIQRAVAIEPGNPALLWRLAWNYLVIAAYARIDNDLDVADSYVESAERITARLMEEEPEDVRNAHQMVNVLEQKAHAARLSSDWESEHRILARCLEILDDTLVKTPEDIDLRTRKLILLHHTALRRHEHQDSDIDALLEEALSIAERIAENANARYEDWIAYSALMREPLLEDRRDTAKSVWAAEQAITRSNGTEYGVYLNLVEALVADGQLARARVTQEQALSLLPPGESPIRTQILSAIPE